MKDAVNPVQQDEDTPWERIARTRWGKYISDVESRAILKAIELATGVAGRTALDIGAGGGRWATVLVDMGWDVVCTETNPEALVMCQSRVPSAECILVDQADMSLPCETESITLLLCIEVPPVTSSDWFSAEASRVLRSGGTMVGIVLNQRSLRGLYGNLVGALRGKQDDYRIQYPRWRNDCRKRGFTIISEEGICWFPFRRQSSSILVPAFTGLEQVLGLRRLPSVSPWIVFVAQKQ